jgi:hypothetical protein
MAVNRKPTIKVKPQGHQTDPFQSAIDYGIDLKMLAANLNRTPSERVRRHQIALDTVEMLRKAKPL